MSLTYFCPYCWSQFADPRSRCPGCGRELLLDTALSYPERLITSLSHPVRDRKMMAVSTLGKLRCRDAVPHFQRIVARERDYYLVREIAEAVGRMNYPECEEVWALIQDHPSPIIRTLARLRRGCGPGEPGTDQDETGLQTETPGEGSGTCQDQAGVTGPGEEARE